MNYSAIGCLELNSIGVGYSAADEMLKAGSVELLEARSTCPGRFLIIVSGDTGSVQSSVEVGRKVGGEMVIDWFVLPNLHQSVVPALNGTVDITEINALGIIETYSAASCIIAADAAAKAGYITLIEIRIAAGLGGKAFLTMTGDVGSVTNSVSAGVAGVGESGPVVSSVVIPSPSAELKQKLL